MRQACACACVCTCVPVCVQYEHTCEVTRKGTRVFVCVCLCVKHVILAHNTPRFKACEASKSAVHIEPTFFLVHTSLGSITTISNIVVCEYRVYKASLTGTFQSIQLWLT